MIDFHLFYDMCAFNFGIFIINRDLYFEMYTKSYHFCTIVFINMVYFQCSNIEEIGDMVL